MNAWDDTLSEQECRTIVFQLADGGGPVSYDAVVAAVGTPPGCVPSPMVRRVYSDIVVGIDYESDLEYLARIGAFPPPNRRSNVDAHQAAVACARAAARDDAHPDAAGTAARRFWGTGA